MKKALKIVLILLLLITVSLISFIFYMAGRSYELANTVVQTPPYKFESSTIDFHHGMFIADMHADTFTFVDSFMQRKDFAHLDFERAREGGFSLLTMAIATEVPLAMVRRKPEGVERGGNLIKFGAVTGFEPIANWHSNYQRGNWVIDNVQRTVSNNPDQLVLVTHREDLTTLLTEHAAGNNNRIGMLLAVEGAHVLEGNLKNLDNLYSRGIRMLSLTHAFDNEYGGASEGVEQYGLTPAGQELLTHLQELGIIIDIAHASPTLVNDLLDKAQSPVVYSHGGIQGMCDIDRNLPETALQKIKANGGLVAIGFWDRVLCGDSAADVAASMRYVADKIGTEHVALGSDFDGGVKTVFDATGLPLLTDALFDAGFSDLEIRQIMGENYTKLLLTSLPTRL
jgi:membrane dipeptidase